MKKMILLLILLFQLQAFAGTADYTICRIVTMPILVITVPVIKTVVYIVDLFETDSDK